jgi:GntR family transcriptional repressor for pyruvate dehydrogenase complex
LSKIIALVLPVLPDNTYILFSLQRSNSETAGKMKKSAPQHAAEMIQLRIRDGEYAVGSTLPGQRQLADELGVGRPAIREAISALEGLGIVEVRPGRGVFVTDPNAPGVAQWRFASQYLPADVYAVRGSLESLAVRIAARRATTEQISHLEQLVDELAHAGERGDVLAMSAADRGFHRTLAEIAGNPLLLEILETFDKVMTESLNVPFRNPNRSHLAAPALEHRRIVEAIRARDEQTASGMMEHHIINAQSRAELKETSKRDSMTANEPSRPGKTGR